MRGCLKSGIVDAPQVERTSLFFGLQNRRREPSRPARGSFEVTSPRPTRRPRRTNPNPNRNRRDTESETSYAISPACKRWGRPRPSQKTKQRLESGNTHEISPPLTCRKCETGAVAQLWEQYKSFLRSKSEWSKRKDMEYRIWNVGCEIFMKGSNRILEQRHVENPSAFWNKKKNNTVKLGRCACVCTREDDLLVSRFQGPDGLQGFQGRWQLYDTVASARLSLEDSAHPSTGFFSPFFLPRFYPSSPVCVCRRRKRGRLVQGFSVYCILRYGSPRGCGRVHITA